MNVKDWAKVREQFDSLFGIDRAEIKAMVNKESKEFRAWRDKTRNKFENVLRKFLAALNLDQLLDLIGFAKDELDGRLK